MFAKGKSASRGNIETAGYFEPKASSFTTARWRLPLAHRITHGYAIPFDDDGGTPAWHARLASRTTFPDLARPDRPCRAAVPAGVHGRGILAGLDVLRARYGTTGTIIALVGIAALAAFIRRHTGMQIGIALCVVAVVGLAGAVWVVFALLAVALVAGCDVAPSVDLERIPVMLHNRHERRS